MTSDVDANHVLIVEDDEATADLERRVLARAGTKSVVVSRIKDALELLDSRRFSAVILDYNLPDGEAWTVVEAADSKRPRIPVILVTGHGNELVASQAIQRGVVDYLKKSGSFCDLLPGIVNRVTDLANAERRLHESDAKFRLMVESVKDYAIFMLNTAGRVASWNAGAAKITGYREEEIIGRHFSCFYTAADLSDGKPAAELATAGTQGRSEEESWRVRKDGKPFMANVAITALHDDAGELQGFINILRDVTALRDTEAQLRRGNDRLQIAVDAAGIGVWEFDIASNRLTWNDWMYRIYGVAPSASEEPYSLWISSVHPDDRERCQLHIDAALRGDGQFDTEFRIVRPDGNVRHVKAASRTSRDSAGRALNMVGVNFDVTDQRRDEQRLYATSSMLRTVLDSASEVSIIAADPDLNISVFNGGAERLLGYTSQEMAGRSLLLLHDAQEIVARGAELGGQLSRPIEGGAVLIEPSMLRRALEWTYVCKDGSHATVSVVVTPMHTYEGELLGYVSVAQDITHQKKHEASLRQATDEAKRASNAKSLFLANMSHEIRTPMNAVIGMTYLLGRTPLTEEQSRFLHQINVASQLLLSVISDVLDLSKIEAGELLIARDAFNPQHLLHGLESIMTPQADAKGISLAIAVDGDLPSALAGDAARLNQILTNLLSNAIKFTERGGVTLTVRRIACAADAVKLRFTVRDTGIGIDTEAQSRLFLPFVQADESITRRFGGTGLGLSIVNRLTRLLGGTVELTSDPGVGTEFRVELEFPLATPEALPGWQTAADTRGAPSLLGVRVLVVDDNDINLQVTKLILEQEGAEVRLAINGSEAIQCLKAQPDCCDVVLMDVQMPILDGYEATRRIRRELELVDLPIVALTAGALSSERQRAAAVGMDDFIVKPFDAPTLIASVMRYGRKPPRPAPALGAPMLGAPMLDAPVLSAPVLSAPVLSAPVLSAPVLSASVLGAPVLTATANALPPTAIPWPDIDGIDTSAARERWCDDLALFRSMLERCLDEYADIGNPASSDIPAEQALQASRFHKLKGGAGLLGAMGIHRLAGEAEAACVAGERRDVERLAGELAAGLTRLRASARAALGATGPDAERAPLVA
jgi:PAS domain S-box-containing protein